MTPFIVHGSFVLLLLQAWTRRSSLTPVSQTLRSLSAPANPAGSPSQYVQHGNAFHSLSCWPASLQETSCAANPNVSPATAPHWLPVGHPCPLGLFSSQYPSNPLRIWTIFVFSLLRTFLWLMASHLIQSTKSLQWPILPCQSGPLWTWQGKISSPSLTCSSQICLSAIL